MSNESGTAGALFANVLGVPSSWMPALANLLLRGGTMLLSPFVG